MTASKPRTHAGLLSVLVIDDQVVAYDVDGLRWAGTVELMAPSLGVIWIRTDKGERKALDIHDFDIRMNTKAAATR